MSGFMDKIKDKLSGKSGSSGGSSSGTDGHKGTTAYGKGIDQFEKVSGYDVPDKYEGKAADMMESQVNKYKSGHSGGGS